jgi:hypothetical protein
MLAKLDLSLEFAHIYADESLSNSQLLSSKIFRDIADRARANGTTLESVVLIDDIHVKNAQEKHQLKQTLISRFEQVDNLIFESELLSASKQLLRALPKKQLVYKPFQKAIRKVLFLENEDHSVSLAHFGNKSFKPTCALLVATWHLLRLGAISGVKITPARTSLSILEEKYREVEEKAKKIIENSDYHGFVSQISHEFYKV